MKTSRFDMLIVFLSCVFILNLSFRLSSYAQVGVAISAGNEDPNPKAILELIANDKGLLISRMSSAERDDLLPLGATENSLIIFNTDINRFQYWDNSIPGWQTVEPGGASGGNEGEIQFNESGSFAGSNLLFWDSLNERLGVGNNAPAFLADITGVLRLGSDAIAGQLRITSGDYSIAINPSNAMSADFDLTLPATLGTNGQALITDASGNLSWANVAGLPSGNDGNVQFNNAGEFAGSDDLFWNNTDLRLGIGTDAPAYTLDVLGTQRLGGEGTSGQLRFYSEQGADDYEVILNPSGAMTANTTLTLPPDGGDPNQFLQTNGSGEMVWADAPTSDQIAYYFSAYDSNDGPTFTTGVQTVDYDVVEINSDPLVFDYNNTNFELTINTTRAMFFAVHVTISSTANNTNFRIWLERNGFGLNGFRSQITTTNQQPRPTTISLSGITNVTSGDVFRVRVERVSGSGTLETPAYTSSFVVHSLAGGNVGPQGPQGDPGPAGTSSIFFEAYDGTGGLQVSPGPTTIPFDQIRQNTNPTVFSIDSEGIITINADDEFLINYRTTIDIISGSNRTESRSWLESRPNSSAAWTEVAGTRVILYHRTAGRGGNTADANALLSVTSGQQFRVRNERLGGTDGLQTLAHGSAITIYNLRGGDQGPAGPPGPIGGDDKQITFNNSGEADGTDDFIWDYDNNRLGVMNVAPEYPLDVAGAIRSGAEGQSGQFRFYSEQGADDYQVIINPSNAMTADYTLTLPVDDGNNGEVLTTDGNGVLSWGAGGGGGGGNPAGNDGNVQFKDGADFAGSDDFFWDNTNSWLGIGTATPAFPLDIDGTLRLGSSANSGQLRLTSNSGGHSFILNPNSAMSGDVTFSLPSSVGNNGQILSTDGAGELSWTDLPEPEALMFMAYDNDTDLDFTAATTIDLNTVQVNSDNTIFSFNTGTGVLTINQDGDFLFNYDVTLGVIGSGGNNSHVFASWIERNGTALDYTRARGTWHSRGDGQSQTVSSNFVLAVTSGEEFRIRAERLAGNGNLQTIANASRLTVTSIGGGSGGGGGGGSPSGNNGNIQFKSGTNFAGNDNLHWDNTNSRLGVLTPTPAYSLDVRGVIRAGGGDNTGQFRLYSSVGSHEVILNPSSSMSGSSTYTLPTSVGANGQMLTSDGTGVLSWSTPPGAGVGSPGGANTQIQYNSSGLFAGSADFVWDNANSRVGIGTNTPREALDVDGAVLRKGWFMATRATSNLVFNSFDFENIEFNSQVRIDDDFFSHNTGTNPEQITIDVSGWYRVSYNINIEQTTGGDNFNNSNRQSYNSRLTRNGNAVTGSISYANTTSRSGERDAAIANSFIVNLTNGDILRLQVRGKRDSNTYGTGAAEYDVLQDSQITIERID